MTQIARYTFVILGTIAAAVLVYQFRTVILLLGISLAITATSRPLLLTMGRFRIPGFLAQLLILVVALGLVLGMIFLIGPTLTSEIQSLTNRSFIWYTSTYHALNDGPSWQQMLLDRLPEPGSLGDTFLGPNGEFILPVALYLTQSLAALLGGLFILLTFSLYWAQDLNRFINFWLSLLPVYQRNPVRNAWGEMEHAVGRYLRHELALGLGAAVLLGIGYQLLGLPYPVTLAILAFIGWFIPLLGFAVILIPVYLSAAGGGWVLVLLGVAYTLLVLMGLKYWIEPRYLHPRRYSSLLIVFWIVVLGNFLGLGGYLAGPVVAVASQALFNQYVQYRSRPRLDEVRLGDLKQQFADTHLRFRQAAEVRPSPQLSSLFDRIDRALAQTEILVDEELRESAG